MQETLEKMNLPEIKPATDAEILAYLRSSRQIAEMAFQTERNNLILQVCEQLNLTVSEEELQIEGDKFRQENKLLGATETLNWLAQQRITVENWSQGLGNLLLTQKLKEHLFGEAVDGHYLNNRDNYQRVALSQILVKDLSLSMQIIHKLKEEKTSFCVLALEYSQGKQSQENGGFVGIRFLQELLPEIAQAIKNVAEGEIINPVQTKLGYHVIKVEKWYRAELKEVREQILNSLFEIWLKGAFQFEQNGHK
jgi:parvulin-like peptidyl-prolyl isomerase